MANDSKNIGNVVERYSKALLELSIESKSLSNVHDDIENILKIIFQNHSSCDLIPKHTFLKYKMNGIKNWVNF